MISSISLLAIAALIQPSFGATHTIDSLRAEYGLTAANFTFEPPSRAMGSGDAVNYMKRNWDLAELYWGDSNIVFTADPSTSTSTLVRRQASTRTSTSTRTRTSAATPSDAVLTTELSGEAPVLRVGYPQGSYSKATGGTQFYANPLNSTDSSSGQYERMLLSYDIWFPSGWAWNQGGKLPGLRGGPNVHGCSGGRETDGTSCFSTRLMWRSSGAGEVYAYVPTTQKDFCSSSGVTCNSDFGTSFGRGDFSFVPGQWQTVYLLVVLNRDGTANGVVNLYYNGVEAVTMSDLVLRKSDSINSVGGLYFSTFFGGDDASWATPTQQYTYYRNMQLYAGYGASNGTGNPITNGASRLVPGGWAVFGITAFTVILAAAGLV